MEVPQETVAPSKEPALPVPVVSEEDEKMPQAAKVSTEAADGGSDWETAEVVAK